MALLRTPGIDSMSLDSFDKTPADYCPDDKSGTWLMSMITKTPDPNHSNATEVWREPPNHP